MCIINNDESNECAVCYMPFFLPISDVEESINEFKTEVLDKYEDICKILAENQDEELSVFKKKTGLSKTVENVL